MDSLPSQIPSSDRPNTWLELAIRNRLDELSDIEKDVFLKATPTLAEKQLLSFVTDYDGRHEELSAIRPRAEEVSKFVSFLEDLMARVLSTGSPSKTDIPALILGGIRAVIDHAITFETFFTKIIDMLCRLADYIKPLSEYTGSNNVMIIEQIAAAIAGILIFCRDACYLIETYRENGRSGSIWAFIRTHWDPFETNFRDMESKLKLHLEVIRQSAASLALDETYKGNFEVELDFYWEQNREKADERGKFLEWLSGPDFEKRHVDIYAKKHPQTADWLFDTDEFKAWFDGVETDLLWVGGKSGIGKSVLVSNVIEYISTMYALDERVCLSYVYYDYRDETLQDISLVISRIMKQTCRQLDEMPDQVLEHWQEYHHGISTEWTAESFCEIAENFEKLIIIVDALNECPVKTRHEIIDFVYTTCRDLPIKLLITSRGKEDLPESFAISKGTTIEMEPGRVTDDIKTFISDQVKRLRQREDGEKLYLDDDSLEDAIVGVLAGQSEGSFLWASLQLESLCRLGISTAPNDQLVRETLDNLPCDLDVTYTRLLRHVETQDTYTKELALKTFLWVFHSRETLSLTDLKHAIAIEHTHTKPDLEEMKFVPNLEETYAIPDLEETNVILKACANLIHEENNTIRPIHRSFFEFIMSGFVEDSDDIPIIKPIRDVSYANQSLALSCLICLTYLPGFQIFHGSRTLNFLRSRPFAHYAANFFDLHLRDVKGLSKEVDHELTQLFGSGGLISDVLLIRKFRSIFNSSYPEMGARLRAPNDPDVLLSSTCLSDVAHIRDRLTEQIRSRTKPEYELHLAAETGCLARAAQLLRNGSYADMEKSIDRIRPLYYACEGGHLPIVSLLLDYGAEVNIGGDYPYFETPLQISSFLGHDGIVEMLLDAGADVNTKGRFHRGNPLQVAAYYGHEKIVKMLLDCGAEVNAHNKYWMEAETALQAASQKGHKRIVQMLLDRGADVNSPNIEPEEWSALQAASLSHHYGVVQLLLDRRAYINAENEDGTALQVASSEGCESIVRLLLDRGADIDAQSRRGNALQAASFAGFVKVVRVLLDHGADIKAQNSISKHGHALQAASANSHEEIVRFLLDRGADANAFNDSSKYGATLQAASSKGSEKIARMLLDSGSDVNIHCRGSRYGNSLQAAASKGHEKVVRLLLDNGADVNAQHPHGFYANALHASSRWGRQEVAQILLDRGADINAPGNGHGNALQVATSNDNEDMVRLFLDHGADVNAADKKKRKDKTALEAAISNGNENMVKLLLENGADVNDDNHKTLQSASYDGHLAIVRLLLDHGADVNNHKGNALHAAASKEHEEIVRLLLDRGAYVDEDKGGTTPTPLEGAAKGGRLEIVRLLLEHGADVHRNNARALQLAGRCISTEVVRLLLDRGAQVMPFKPRKK